MSATAIIPKCRLDPHGADVSPKLRPAPGHTPARRLQSHAAAMPMWRSMEGGQFDAPSLIAAPGLGPNLGPNLALISGSYTARGFKAAPGRPPHVLHIDNDADSARDMAVLLTPEARVTHVPTVDAARAALREQVFSVVVIDPNLPDGDAAELLPALGAIPLLVYSASQPHWRNWAGVYLPKPWTSRRKLWSTISKLLGIPTFTPAGD